MDRRDEVALLPLDDDEADELLASIIEAERTECWWLVLRDGRPIRGDRGGAVLLLVAMWVTRPFGRFLDVVGLSPALDWADKVLARFRGRRGRFVPDGPAPRSFP